MEIVLGGEIGGSGFFTGKKLTPMVFATIEFYFGNPAASCFVPINTQTTRRVVCWRPADVVLVFRRRDWPQITPAGICAHPVDVINLIRWQFSGHVQEGEAMQQVNLPINADLPVSSFVTTTRHRASTATNTTQPPRENPGLGIVIHQLFEPCPLYTSPSPRDS